MTIQGANINPSISQCKNCWKWEYTMFTCQAQESKCAKYNKLHKTEHHCQFVWYYKANFKINPLRLEIKQGEPCPHSFKCLNCKGNHQADSNIYPF